MLRDSSTDTGRAAPGSQPTNEGRRHASADRRADDAGRPRDARRAGGRPRERGGAPPSLTGPAVTGETPAGAPASEAPARPNCRAPDAALGGRYRAGGIDHDIYIVRLTSMGW